MSIKGAANDEAVLCTADKTYTLRLAESSNSMLLAPKTKKRPHEASRYRQRRRVLMRRLRRKVLRQDELICKASKTAMAMATSTVTTC